MRLRIILAFLVSFLLVSCNKQAVTNEEDFDYQRLEEADDEIREVIYSMVLPTDMASVFSRSGTNYNPSLPASIDDLTLYIRPEKIALMLGVLGTDIMYMKMLDQTAPVAQYLKAVEQLAGKIEIPAEIFTRSSEQLEKYFNNEDSLASVIERIYRETDRYFREAGKENLTALSLTGGWIEAMNIGIRIYESDKGNQVLAERILQQKYSLNSIYTMLSNYQESLEVKGYLLLLKRLRKSFDEVEIRYQKEGFSVDTTQKKLHSYSAEIVYGDETLKNICSIIPQIRMELIRHDSAY